MKNLVINLLIPFTLFLGVNYTSTHEEHKSKKIETSTMQTTVIRDSLIDKFVGTWTFSNRNTDFKLVLIKTETKIGSKDSKVSVEQLNGGYSLFNGGREVTNTLAKKPLWGSSNGNKNIVTFSIHNKKSDTFTNIAIRYVDKDHIVIEQSRVRAEGARFEQEHNIPLNITLERQK